MPSTRTIISRETTFPPLPGAPRADLSDIGLKLAKLPNVQHAFFPSFLKPTAIAQFPDMAAPDTWSSEAQANNPQPTIIGGQPAYSFSNAAKQALRLGKNDQHRSWCFLAAVELTADTMADQTSTRTLLTKINNVAVGLALVYSGGAQHWLITQGGQNLIFTTAAQGQHIVCCSYNVDDGSIALYVDGFANNVGLAGGIPGTTFQGRWSLGGTPGQNDCFTGRIGHALIMDAPLHGAADRDANRRFGMQTLASFYGVGLS